MNVLPLQAIKKSIPMSGIEPVLSGPGGYLFEGGKMVHKAMAKPEQEGKANELVGSHLASETFAALFGIPPGLLQAGTQIAEIKEELGNGNTMVAGINVSETVAGMGGQVLKPEDALKADGGGAGKIIDRTADKKAAEAKHGSRNSKPGK